MPGFYIGLQTGEALGTQLDEALVTADFEAVEAEASDLYFLSAQPRNRFTLTLKDRTMNGTAFALHKGNILDVPVIPSSPTGAAVDALTITGYLALEKGGAAITSPATAITLVRDVDTGVYEGSYSVATVNALIALNPAGGRFWLALEIENAFLGWVQIPVITDRVIVSP